MIHTIDNFAAIRSHLRFDNPGDIYVVHVLFRVKDLRTDEVYSTMYEQFECEYNFGNIVFRFNYSYNDRDKVTYADFLSKFDGLQKG